MGSSLMRKLRSHWARAIKDKRIAIQLLKVNPFIFFACRFPCQEKLMNVLEEPFAVLTYSFDETTRLYDGNLWMYASFSDHLENFTLKCSRKIRLTEFCFWLIRLLNFVIKFDDEKKNYIAIIDSFSIIQEFHTNPEVFHGMDSVMNALSACNKAPKNANNVAQALVLSNSCLNSETVSLSSKSSSSSLSSMLAKTEKPVTENCEVVLPGCFIVEMSSPKPTDNMEKPLILDDHSPLNFEISPKSHASLIGLSPTTKKLLIKPNSDNVKFTGGTHVSNSSGDFKSDHESVVDASSNLSHSLLQSLRDLTNKFMFALSKKKTNENTHTSVVNHLPEEMDATNSELDKFSRKRRNSSEYLFSLCASFARTSRWPYSPLESSTPNLKMNCSSFNLGAKTDASLVCKKNLQCLLNPNQTEPIEKDIGDIDFSSQDLIMPSSAKHIKLDKAKPMNNFHQHPKLVNFKFKYTQSMKAVNEVTIVKSDLDRLKQFILT